MLSSCSWVSLLFFLLSLSSSIGNADSSLHYCNSIKKPEKINLGHIGEWGYLKTPGFPTTLRTPLNCSWILDFSTFTTDPNLGLFLYLTQVYVKHKFIHIRMCEDPALKNCSQYHELHRQAYFRNFSNPFVQIRLDIPRKPDVHLRLMELNDLYGVNMVYEVASRSNRDDNFAKCSALLCHFNGECIVKASKAGDRIERMECECRKPLDEYSLHAPSFYGPNCQYHNKHGHCTGPGDNHYDAVRRCSGQPCSYLTSRYVRCNCNPGYSGRNCETSVQKENVSSVSGDHKTVLTIQLNDRLEQLDRYEVLNNISRTWEKACNCAVDEVPSDDQNDIGLAVKGNPELTSQLVEKINKENMIGDVPIVSVRENYSVPLVRIEKVSINQQNPINTSRTFIISCLAEGGPNMVINWFKDDLQVNLTVKKRFLVQDIVEKNAIPGEDRWSMFGLLHITDAGRYDSGMFRCEVEDEGIVVSKSLDSPVIVAEPPRVEVYPSALILENVAGEIQNSVTDSSIFCLAKVDDNTMTSKFYRFTWLRRWEGAPVSHMEEIDFNKDPEELEYLTMPEGVVLRLKHVTRSAIYTCRVFFGDKETDLEVPVFLTPSRYLQSSTCHRSDMMVVWPQTRINSVISRPCSGDDRGYMTRKCEERVPEHRGKSGGKWSDIDETQCVRMEIFVIRDHLETIKAGYTKDGDGENLGSDVLSYLYNACKEPPRLKEWYMILEILLKTVTYLNNKDKQVEGGSRYDWTRQLSTAKHDFFHLIKFLLSDARRFQLREKILDILYILRRNSLVLGRELKPAGSHSFSSFSFQPYGQVYVSKVDLTEAREAISLNGGELKETRPGWMDGIRVYLSPREDSARSSKHQIYTVSVVYLEQLAAAVHEAAHKQNPFEYLLNSHLVTISLEFEKVQENRVLYYQNDGISLGKVFWFSIEFSFLNNSFNRSRRTVRCGEISAISGRGEPKMKLSENCRLVYTNQSGAVSPTCLCNRTGTYGLLVDNPGGRRSGSLMTMVTKPVVYGCLISLILSVLSWALLFKSYLFHSSKLITVLKVLTTTGVIVSNLIFLVCLTGAIPQNWYHTSSVGLQISMLTCISSQLGISILLLLQYRPLLKSRKSSIGVFLVSALAPSILIALLSVGCNMQDSSSGDWWLHFGGFHFNSYLSVLTIVVLFLGYILGLTWHVLTGQRRPADEKNPGLEESLGTLQRSILVSIMLVLYNIISIVYFNFPGSSLFMQYLFAVVSAFVGLTILLCYILVSESYILVWCGDRKLWQEIKLHQEKIRESHCDSGASRLTSSSRRTMKSAQDPSLPKTSVNLTGEKISETNSYPLGSVGSGSGPSVQPSTGDDRSEMFRKSVRPRCYIRDDQRDASAPHSQPETLSQLLGRASKRPGPNPSEQTVKVAMASFEYRTSSRRSTVTSNMTLVTSSDASEYVQQEKGSPDRARSGETYDHISPSESSLHASKVPPDSKYNLNLFSGKLYHTLASPNNKGKGIASNCNGDQYTIDSPLTDVHQKENRTSLVNIPLSCSSYQHERSLEASYTVEPVDKNTVARTRSTNDVVIEFAAAKVQSLDFDMVRKTIEGTDCSRVNMYSLLPSTGKDGAVESKSLSDLNTKSDLS